MLGVLVFGLTLLASAGNPQRIGHTTLVPRHSNPDDKGMYTAFIDPTNGYAYFVGNYLFKLDITGNLPVQVGPATNTGQFINSAIDPAAGYVYFAGSTLRRRSEEHTSELQSLAYLVCRLLLEKKKKK